MWMQEHPHAPVLVLLWQVKAVSILDVPCLCVLINIEVLSIAPAMAGSVHMFVVWSRRQVSLSYEQVHSFSGLPGCCDILWLLRYPPAFSHQIRAIIAHTSFWPEHTNICCGVLGIRIRSSTLSDPLTTIPLLPDAPSLVCLPV
jgi:hypothetical protein